MRLVTNTECDKWVKTRGLVCDRDTFAKGLGYPDTHAVIRCPLPPIATDMVGLAYELCAAEVREFSEASAGPALLWLRRWEIWSESIDAVGYTYLAGVLREKAVDLAETPGLLFDVGDFLSCYSAVALPMLFQWDAYFVPGHGAFSARISHEGNIDLAPSSEAVARSLLHRFGRYGAGAIPSSV